MTQSILHDPLLTPHQLAVLLGRNDRTLAYWRGVKKGPTPTKIEGKLAYFASDVDRWLREQTTKTKEDI
jgi:hypothetical protein